MLIVVVGRVVGQFVLDAGSRGTWVTATEGYTIHQVTPIHIALDTTR